MDAWLRCNALEGGLPHTGIGQHGDAATAFSAACVLLRGYDRGFIAASLKTE